ncbi:hypothetical protein Tco_0017401 [Tanacetum coccineum]
MLGGRATKDLLTPFEEPERVFRLARKLFKTTSLDYSSSLEFDLFYDLKNQSEKEFTEAMTDPTMEEYITKTQNDYGSGIASPNIDDKAHFGLNVQFLKELLFPMSLTGTASCWLRNEPAGSIDTWETLKKKFLSKYCPPARTAKKMEEINNFQQEPDETLYQAWERFK